MSEVSSTFCVLPWAHLATNTDGSVLLCCVAQNNLNLNLNSTTLATAWNSEQLKSVRLKMLRGEAVKACTHCYREEAVGYESHRLIENKTWQQRQGPEWLPERLAATSETGELDAGLVSIDLRLGNTCNLTCVMCRPTDSSRWVGLGKKVENNLRNESLFHEWYEKNQITKNRFEWYTRPEFWEDLDSLLPSIRELIIGGGEPMLLAEHRQLIEKCISSGHAAQIQLRYHTNGTILDERIFELWKHFKLVEVFVSLDGIEGRNHYMRYPAAWPAIQSNLKKLDSYSHGNLRAMLLCSVHLMSVFYLDEYARWVEEQKFSLISMGTDGYFHPGLVHYPEYLSVQVLPPEVKKMVEQKIRTFEAKSRKPSIKIDGIINFMNETDRSNLLGKTREYIRALDVARKISFSDSLPELHRLLGF